MGGRWRVYKLGDFVVRCSVYELQLECDTEEDCCVGTYVSCVQDEEL